MRTLSICTLLAGVRGSVELATEQTSLLQKRMSANADMAAEVLLQTRSAASADTSAQAEVDCLHSTSKCKPKTTTPGYTTTTPGYTTTTPGYTTTTPGYTTTTPGYTTTTPGYTTTTSTTSTTTTSTTSTTTSTTTTTTPGYITTPATTTTTTPMDVPPTNCPSPDDAYTCHFWGDPHFTHLFYMEKPEASAACPVGTCGKKHNCFVHHWDKPCFKAQSEAACHQHGGCWTPTHMDARKGGRMTGSSKLFNFNPSGVFELAESADGSFEAQAFFCPAYSGTTTGVGLAMRFGDDLIQVVRSAATAPKSEDPQHPDYWAVLRGSDEDFTEFFVNGEKKSWGELGDAIGTRGADVTGTGGIATGNAYMQQMQIQNGESQKTMTPVCVGDGKNLVEVGTPHFEVGWSDKWPVVYEHAVTVRSSSPGDSGICSSSMEEVQDGEKFRVDAKKNLFSTRQMKTLCDVCRLDMQDGACGAPGHTVSAEDVCYSVHPANAGEKYEAAKAACRQEFDEGSEWFSVCVMETCASGMGAVAIAKIEEQMQEEMMNH